MSIIFTQIENLVQTDEKELNFTIRLRYKLFEKIYMITFDVVSATTSIEDIREISNIRVEEFGNRAPLQTGQVFYDVIMKRLNEIYPLDECLTVAA